MMPANAENTDGTPKYITAEYDADVEKLLTMIYHKTRAKVDRTDPVVAMFYANCFAYGRLEDSLRQAHEGYRQSLEPLMTNIQNTAKTNAEAVINASIVHGNTVITAAIKEAADVMKKEAAKALEDIHNARREVREDFAKVSVGREKVLRLMKYSAVVSSGAAFAALAALAFALHASGV